MGLAKLLAGGRSEEDCEHQCAHALPVHPAHFCQSCLTCIQSDQIATVPVCQAADQFEIGFGCNIWTFTSQLASGTLENGAAVQTCQRMACCLLHMDIRMEAMMAAVH